MRHTMAVIENIPIIKMQFFALREAQQSIGCKGEK